MAKFTVVIEGDTLKRARIRALKEGASVNAVLRSYVAECAGRKAPKKKAINNLLRLSQHAKSRRGNQRWTRDELHERWS